jgi:hypothetical protein
MSKSEKEIRARYRVVQHAIQRKTKQLEKLKKTDPKFGSVMRDLVALVEERDRLQVRLVGLV